MKILFSMLLRKTIALVCIDSGLFGRKLTTRRKERTYSDLQLISKYIITSF